MAEPPCVSRLRAVVDAAEPRLRAIPDEATTIRPAPDKWSPREIVGHLIDSASNNHQRFVRARWMNDLVFEAYEQDGWVEAGDYQGAPWLELIVLLAGFNRQIARVMASVPEEIRTRAQVRHNLDRVAWQTLPPSHPATLDYFMSDYVGHLEHHLRQVLGSRWTDGIASHDIVSGTASNRSRAPTTAAREAQGDEAANRIAPPDRAPQAR